MQSLVRPTASFRCWQRPTLSCRLRWRALPDVGHFTERDVSNDLAKHQIEPRSEFFGKMPHRPGGTCAGKPSRAGLTVRGPVHGPFEKQRSKALPAPLYVH